MLMAAPAYCAQAAIDDMTVSKDPLKVSFVVKDSFTKDIEEAVRSGMPTAFNFIVELNRLRSVWTDELIVRREFKHTVRYDSLKEEYEITLDETGEKLKTRDFADMKRIMASATAVLNGKPLTPGEEYEVRVMAELDPVELPMLLDYMLFFVKLWDFETDWYAYKLTP